MNSPDFSTRGLFGWRDQSSWQLLLLVIVLGLSAWMMSHMREVVNPTQELEPEITAEPKAEEMPKPRARPFVGFDDSNDRLPETARESFQEACVVLRRAITSGSTALLVDCVRHPSVTMPRVRMMPLSRQAEFALPLSIGPKFGITGDLLLTTVRLKDGTDRAVVLEKTAEGYKLDGESFTGWCEADFSTLQTYIGINVHPMLMRVRCQPRSARAPFTDEKGISLVISHPAEHKTLSAFVPETVLKRSAAGTELRNSSGGPFVLLIKPERATMQHGWVRVEEIICSGWVTDR